VVNVLSTGSWGVANPLLDAVFTSASSIHGDVITSAAFPRHAWSINFADPGIHKLDLETKSSTFIQLNQTHGCSKVASMVVSPENRHGYLSCYNSSFKLQQVLEINLDTDEVSWPFPMKQAVC
jgi:hypothetical protein